MKKIIKGLLLIIPMMFIVTGCGAGDIKEQELSDAFDKEKLKVASEKVIENINSGDYDKVFEVESDQMKDIFPVEKIKETFDPLKKKLGGFESFEDVKMVEKEGLAVVVTYVKYKNAKVQYQQSYTTEMKLDGIYIK